MLRGRNMKERKMLPVGIEDFETVIRQCYYIDKTKLIDDILKNPDGTVFLFTRPRRFGKSLALSSMDYFFSSKHKDKAKLFSGLAIEKSVLFSSEQGSYPLIHLNLKAIHQTSFDSLIESISLVMSILYSQYPELEKSEMLSPNEKKDYLSVLDCEKNPIKLSFSLYKLTQLLYKHYQKRVVLLIDEYDAPILRAENDSNFNETLAFFRTFYGMVLKGNDAIKYAAVTGVLQIAKESLFSDLNNLNIDNVLSGNYSEYFGFSEKETKELLSYYGYSDKYDEIKEWYDGYIFGGTRVFNPWSVLKFIESKGKFSTYWISTGENSLLKKMLFETNDQNVDSFLTNIFFHNGVYENVDTSVTFSEAKDVSSIASYLLATGYITTSSITEDGRYLLTIPNKEVITTFRKEILNKYVSFDQKDWAKELKDAFISGDEETIKNSIENYVISAFSYYEYGTEKNYQCLILGMSAILFADYKVKSEVNVGKGRCDIIISPKSGKRNGIIIELKCLKGKASASNMEKSAKSALEQIKKNDYFSEFRENGFNNVMIYGASFFKNKIEIASENIVFKKS